MPDVTNLPLSAGSADLLVDRGCFHYLPPAKRAGYAREAGRVLRPGGRLLLRMCLNSAGVRNALDRMDLVSDTRAMPAIRAILVAPGETFVIRSDTIELMPERIRRRDEPAP